MHGRLALVFQISDKRAPILFDYPQLPWYHEKKGGTRSIFAEVVAESLSAVAPPKVKKGEAPGRYYIKPALCAGPDCFCRRYCSVVNVNGVSEQF